MNKEKLKNRRSFLELGTKFILGQFFFASYLKAWTGTRMRKSVVQPNLICTNEHNTLIGTLFQTTYTYTSCSIGAAPTEGKRRFIFVSVGGIGTSVANRTLTSMTIGGLTPTITQVNSLPAIAAISWVEVPTGTSLSVVLNFNADMNGSAISVYSVISGPRGITTDTDTDTGRPIDTTLDFPVGSIGISTVANRNGSTHTWTGLSESYDVDMETTDQFSSAMSTFSTASNSHAIQANSVNTGNEHAGISCSIRKV